MKASATLYSIPIAHTHGGSERRNAEADAENILLEKAFGPGCHLAHHPDGAPYAKGHEDVCISISHNKDICILAVSGGIIGIDTETWREQLVRTADRFISSTEKPYIVTPTDLLQAWTAKEAVYKAARTRGLGLKEICIAPDRKTCIARGQIYDMYWPEISLERTTALATKRVIP